VADLSVPGAPGISVSEPVREEAAVAAGAACPTTPDADMAWLSDAEEPRTNTYSTLVIKRTATV
jgi:hypothetical protein